MNWQLSAISSRSCIALKWPLTPDEPPFDASRYVTIEPGWPGKRHEKGEDTRDEEMTRATVTVTGESGDGFVVNVSSIEACATHLTFSTGVTIIEKYGPFHERATERAKKSACAGREYQEGSDTSKIGVTYLRHVDG